ncbi:wax ester/triacylglycerol synthase domain-containing protein [Streptomyces avidinii]|uniref:wax ester/triacylglycerol synthase domain-containing protein n=1 Tax=Streptomyces avidinii TaxID=1895 RepID=UPI0037A08F72
MHARGAAPELSRVQEQVAGRIERMPTLACTVTRRGGRTVWEADPAFDPHDHVHEIRIPPGPHALNEAVDGLLRAPLDEDSPRWGVWLIHGYSDHQYVLFYRAHHAAQDGQAMMDALTALFGTRPPGSVSPAVGAPGAGRETGAGWWRRSTARAVTWLLADAVKSLRPPLGWSTRHALSGEVQVLSAAVPESWLRETGLALGASPNEVCLAALAEAVRNWMPESWIAPEQRGRELYVNLPISVRAPEERFTMGNRISAVRIPVSFWEESPTARVAAIARATRPVKTEGMRRALRAQLSLPESLVYQIFRSVAAKAEGSLATSGLMRLPGRLAMGKDPIETVVTTAFLDKDPFEMVFLAYGGQAVASVTIDRAVVEVGNLVALWAEAVERLHRENVAGVDEQLPVAAPS